MFEFQTLIEPLDQLGAMDHVRPYWGNIQLCLQQCFRHMEDYMGKSGLWGFAGRRTWVASRACKASPVVIDPLHSLPAFG